MYHVNAWYPRRQKRALNLLQLELQMICEPSCGCWKENLALWMSHQRSSLLSHFSNPKEACVLK